MDDKKQAHLVIAFLEEKDKRGNWHKLRGSAKGIPLTEALLRARREDSKRDK